MVAEEVQKEVDRGVMLPLMESFYTIQGEGAFTGVAAWFIRLGGCDVGCHWCDVKESWDAERHPPTTVADIVRQVAAGANTAVVTGGEPLMWDMTALTVALKQAGLRTHIETSGAYTLSGEWDWICLSPKKTKLPLEDVYQHANELKIIIHNKHDFTFAEEQAAKVSSETILFLQPEWSRQQEMIPLLVDYVKKYPKWRISLQTHKYLDIP